jgi:hypothetical protein
LIEKYKLSGNLPNELKKLIDKQKNMGEDKKNSNEEYKEKNDENKSLKIKIPKINLDEINNISLTTPRMNK